VSAGQSFDVVLGQVGPVRRRLRWLAQQFLAARKGAKQLVIQVIAIGQDHNRGVLHRRV